MQFKKNGDISVSGQELKGGHRAELARLIPLPRVQRTLRVRDLLPGLTAGRYSLPALSGLSPHLLPWPCPGQGLVVFLDQLSVILRRVILVRLLKSAFPGDAPTFSVQVKLHLAQKFDRRPQAGHFLRVVVVADPLH